MPGKSRTSKSTTRSKAPAQSVDALLASLDHPHLPAIFALREIIRGAGPGIGEEIKWNAPSFHTAEHFATFQLRHRAGVQIVLHLGVKPRPDAEAKTRVADPGGLLEWRGVDRALVTFAGLADVEAKRDAFGAILRQWITLVS